MSSTCFYFQVHQPRRIKKYRIFDVGRGQDYFETTDDSNRNNKKIILKVAEKSYLPANACMLDLLKRHPEFKISYSISGMALEQFAEYAPAVLDSWKRLIDTGRVELLSETYYHSLASIRSPKEFETQIALHKKALKDIFGVTPKVFRNTELIYNNAIGDMVAGLGFSGILSEGADHILKGRSPNFVYRGTGAKKIKLLLKNYKLSDDVAFRFSSRDWSEFPLTAEKFAHWLSAHNGSGDIVNLFMDYETFGEHQWADTGIFNFLSALPREILKHKDNNFVTPTEALARYPARDSFDAPHAISWADIERDLSAWLSNPIQHEALRMVYSMEQEVLRSGNKKLIDDWRRLQTSDHFYYMCTKWFADGDVHKYFNPYDSPYEAFIAYSNVMKDMQIRLKAISSEYRPPRTFFDSIKMFFNKNLNQKIA